MSCLFSDIQKSDNLDAATSISPDVIPSDEENAIDGG